MQRMEKKWRLWKVEEIWFNRRHIVDDDSDKEYNIQSGTNTKLLFLCIMYLE
jgi:hypothetical protein